MLVVQMQSTRPQGDSSLLSTFTPLSQEAFWGLPTGVDATCPPLTRNL